MADAYAALEDEQELSSTLADPTAQDMIAAASCTGRSTLFCCLSCGMPYAFPDHAYMSDDRQAMLGVLAVVLNGLLGARV